MTVYSTQDAHVMRAMYPIARAIHGNPDPLTTMLIDFRAHLAEPEYLGWAAIAWSITSEGIPVGWGLRTPRRMMVFVAPSWRRSHHGTTIVEKLLDETGPLNVPHVWSGTDTAYRFWERFGPQVQMGAFPERG
jgi:hypothetical protein